MSTPFPPTDLPEQPSTQPTTPPPPPNTHQPAPQGSFTPQASYTTPGTFTPGATPTGSYGTPMGRMPHIPQMPDLPKRTGGVVALVVGLVTMLILAPIGFFFAAAIGAASNISALDPQTGPEEFVAPVIVGEQLTVDSTGLVALGADQNTPNLPTACQLDSASGSHILHRDASSSDGLITFNGFGIPQGTYTLTCTPETSTGTVQFDQFKVGSALSLFGPGLVAGLIVSAVLSLIGLILTIYGIVRIVKVNKRRREILSRSGF